MEITERETLQREGEIQVEQKDLSNEEKYCDRGDRLFSSSGVCFERGVDRDVTYNDNDNNYMCSSGSCFECGL